MHPKKHQHKKKHPHEMIYGGVRVPGFPAWALWMSAYGGYGGGYMSGATPGNDTGNGGTAQNGDIEGGGTDAGAGDGGTGGTSA